MLNISIRPFIIITIIILSAVQVIMLNRYSIVGEKLQKFDIEIIQYQGQNIALAEKIASSSSITAISQKAINIGLTQKLDTASLDIPLPVAYNLQSSI